MIRYQKWELHGLHELPNVDSKLYKNYNKPIIVENMLQDKKTTTQVLSKKGYVATRYTTINGCEGD